MSLPPLGQDQVHHGPDSARQPWSALGEHRLEKIPVCLIGLVLDGERLGIVRLTRLNTLLAHGYIRFEIHVRKILEQPLHFARRVRTEFGPTNGSFMTSSCSGFSQRRRIGPANGGDQDVGAGVS